jgi:hypothetical protein
MQRALFVGVAVLAAAIAGVALWVYLSLDHLVERAIEHYGSEIVQAAVSVEEVKLAPAGGAGVLRGLAVGNPSGFRTPHAATVTTIELAIDPATVTQNVILVKRIVVVSPAIVYEPGPRGSNFDAIRRNVERHVGADKPAATGSGGRRLIVERLTIKGGRVNYVPAVATGKATLSFDLPDINLANVGQGRGGVTPGELAKIVVGALMARMAEVMGRAAVQRGVGTLLGR